MKTSNYILLSFLLFLFGGITLLCFGSRYYKSIDARADFVNQEKQLPPFSVVVAEPGAIFNLRNANENKIIQTYLKGTVPNIASFEVRNDTLFIYSEEPKQGKMKHTRNVTEFLFINIKSIVTKENSDVYLENLETDTLDINMSKSRLNWKFNKSSYVEIVAKNSVIDLTGDCIDKINLQLDKTALNINSKNGTKQLSGSLINDSYVGGFIDGKMSLTVDKSSRMHFEN